MNSINFTAPKDRNQPVAVLTGDIVNSSTMNLEQRIKLQTSFLSLSEILKSTFYKNVPYTIKNFRGDSWQLLVETPSLSLLISIFIRCYFRFTFSEENIDTRIAIGVGRTAFIPSRNFTSGDGPAFKISGHLLDELKEGRMAIGFEENYPFAAAFSGYLLLLDYLISSWSTSQCQAVYWDIQGNKQSQIAMQWIPTPISQAAVSKHLSAIGWKQIKQSLYSFTNLLAHI